ncbi:cytochrome c3 family protein [Parvibacter caecicola]|uniref:cytochrome c3 family protein n=1 Tax=Parvibacter caecicola TaxID=747645 RepID=UPI00249BA478|nr:cytochrome c3 family protein [Parvibacter caecicola]
MKKKNCLAAVVVGVLLVAGLAGCGSQGGEAVSSVAPTVPWQGITATPASLEDKAEFKLSDDSDCEACHEAEVESATDGECLAGNPAHADLTCIDCHPSDKALVKVHSKIDADSKPKNKLKKTSVVDEACLQCHDTEAIEAATPAEAFLTDLNGTSVNPHAAKAMTASHADLNCVSCHVTHKDGDVNENAYKACLSCHHAEVFECGTCH